VLGLMVFAYITARMILFATAWAATAKENMEAAPVAPPAGAVINPRVQVREGLGPVGVLTATAVGALGAFGFSRFARRR
jgi:membrane protein